VAAIEFVRRTREPLVLADACRHPSFAADPYVAAHEVRSLLALPILRLGKLVGVLSLENNLVTRAFTAQRIRVLQLLSSQIAISLDNSLLFEKLTREIDERLRAEARLRFLAESGAVLGQSLDFETTLTKVARLAISFLADWCTIDLLEQGTLRRVIAAHRVPGKEALLLGVRGADGPGSSAAAEVILTGRSILHPDCSPELLAKLVPDPAACQRLQEVGCRSVMIIPLGGEGQRFGAMTLTFATPERQHGPEDLALAEELARRAALALDNARLYRETREAVRQRDEFLSIASHELNTPLAVLTLTIDNLRQAHELEANEPTIRARLLGIADRQGRRLSRLVADLLDVTRLESGPLPLTRQPVALGTLVREAVASYSAEVARSGCTLTIVEDNEREPLTGDWDPARVKQVVLNLLSNAIKFSPHQPIELRLARMGDQAHLSVRDHGMGLAPGAAEHIFQRFARGVSATHYGGLGLGLYISRQLVQAHGGTITVDSQPGAGATFLVSLPCQPPA
jgi:signal transduction histidine kinase